MATGHAHDDQDHAMNLSNVSLTVWPVVKGPVVSLDVSGNLLDTCGEVPPTLLTLSVKGNALPSFEGLVPVDQLKLVNASTNRLKSLSGLEPATSLQQLNLSHNALHDVEATQLRHHPLLEVLVIKDNALTVLPTPSSLPNLTALDVSGNSLDSIVNVSQYPTLHVLLADSNQIHVGPAKSIGTSGVNMLSLKKNKLSSLAKFTSSSLPSLTHLNVDSNNLKTVSELAFVPNICTLTARFNAIRSDRSATDPLFLPDVRTLSLDGNRLQHLQWLGGCPVIERVYAARNVISGISSKFPMLPSLMVLDLPYNKIEDVSGLAMCPNLVAVRLDHNQLCSVAAVVRAMVNLRSLTELGLRGNPLNDGFYTTEETSPTSALRTGTPRAQAGEARIGPDGRPEVRPVETEARIAAALQSFPTLAEVEEIAPLLDETLARERASYRAVVLTKLAPTLQSLDGLLISVEERAAAAEKAGQLRETYLAMSAAHGETPSHRGYTLLETPTALSSAKPRRGRSPTRHPRRSPPGHKAPILPYTDPVPFEQSLRPNLPPETPFRRQVDAPSSPPRRAVHRAVATVAAGAGAPLRTPPEVAQQRRTTPLTAPSAPRARGTPPRSTPATPPQPEWTSLLQVDTDAAGKPSFWKLGGGVARSPLKDRELRGAQVAEALRMPGGETPGSPLRRPADGSLSVSTLPHSRISALQSMWTATGSPPPPLPDSPDVAVAPPRGNPQPTRFKPHQASPTAPLVPPQFSTAAVGSSSRQEPPPLPYDPPPVPVAPPVEAIQAARRLPSFRVTPGGVSFDLSLTAANEMASPGPPSPTTDGGEEEPVLPVDTTDEPGPPQPAAVQNLADLQFEVTATTAVEVLPPVEPAVEPPLPDAAPIEAAPVTLDAAPQVVSAGASMLASLRPAAAAAAPQLAREEPSPGPQDGVSTVEDGDSSEPERLSPASDAGSADSMDGMSRLQDMLMSLNSSAVAEEPAVEVKEPAVEVEEPVVEVEEPAVAWAAVDQPSEAQSWIATDADTYDRLRRQQLQQLLRRTPTPAPAPSPPRPKGGEPGLEPTSPVVEEETLPPAAPESAVSTSPKWREGMASSSAAAPPERDASPASAASLSPKRHVRSSGDVVSPVAAQPPVHEASPVSAASLSPKRHNLSSRDEVSSVAHAPPLPEQSRIVVPGTPTSAASLSPKRHNLSSRDASSPVAVPPPVHEAHPVSAASLSPKRYNRDDLSPGAASPRHPRSSPARSQSWFVELPQGDTTPDEDKALAAAAPTVGPGQWEYHGTTWTFMQWQWEVDQWVWGPAVHPPAAPRATHDPYSPVSAVSEPSSDEGDVQESHATQTSPRHAAVRSVGTSSLGQEASTMTSPKGKSVAVGTAPVRTNRRRRRRRRKLVPRTKKSPTPRNARARADVRKPHSSNSLRVRGPKRQARKKSRTRRSRLRSASPPAAVTTSNWVAGLRGTRPEPRGRSQRRSPTKRRPFVVRASHSPTRSSGHVADPSPLAASIVASWPTELRHSQSPPRSRRSRSESRGQESSEDEGRSPHQAPTDKRRSRSRTRGLSASSAELEPGSEADAGRRSHRHRRAPRALSPHAWMPDVVDALASFDELRTATADVVEPPPVRSTMPQWLHPAEGIAMRPRHHTFDTLSSRSSLSSWGTEPAEPKWSEPARGRRVQEVTHVRRGGRR